MEAIMGLLLCAGEKSNVAIQQMIYSAAKQRILGLPSLRETWKQSVGYSHLLSSLEDQGTGGKGGNAGEQNNQAMLDIKPPCTESGRLQWLPSPMEASPSDDDVSDNSEFTFDLEDYGMDEPFLKREDATQLISPPATDGRISPAKTPRSKSHVGSNTGGRSSMVPQRTGTSVFLLHSNTSGLWSEVKPLLRCDPFFGTLEGFPAEDFEKL